MVVTIDTTAAIRGWPMQRKHGRANGRDWYFYSDATNLCLKSSLDSVTWSAKTTIQSGGVDVACDGCNKFAIWIDGMDIHYVRVGANMMYRKGTLNADGTITWVSDEVQAATGTKLYPTICVDDYDYPYIGYLDGTYPYVNKSSTNDGSWTDDIWNNFPYRLNLLHLYSHPLVVPLNGGKILAIWSYSYIRHKAYNGDGTWATMVSSSFLPNNASYLSACTESGGDICHIVYPRATTYYHYTYTYTYSTNSLSAETLLQNSLVSSDVCPVIGIDLSTNNLLVFWAYAGTAKVYYHKFSGGSWAATLELCTDANGFGNPYGLNCDYKMVTSKILVAWEAGVSPFKRDCQSYDETPAPTMQPMAQIM